MPSDSQTAKRIGYCGTKLLRYVNVTSNLMTTLHEIPLSTLGDGVIGCILVYDKRPDDCLGHVEYETND